MFIVGLECKDLLYGLQVAFVKNLFTVGKEVGPLTQKLIDDLKAWCDEPDGYGRRAQVARLLDTDRQTITNWFRGKQQPTGEQALQVLELLKANRRR
jgi:hypothetical protein